MLPAASVAPPTNTDVPSVNPSTPSYDPRPSKNTVSATADFNGAGDGDDSGSSPKPPPVTEVASNRFEGPTQPPEALASHNVISRDADRDPFEDTSAEIWNVIRFPFAKIRPLPLILPMGSRRTVNSPVLVLPAASVAEHVTVVSPIGKVNPDGGSHSQR